MKLVSSNFKVILHPFDDETTNPPLMLHPSVVRNDYDPSLILMDEFHREELENNTFAVYVSYNDERYYLDNSGSRDIVSFVRGQKGILTFDENQQEICYNDSPFVLQFRRTQHGDSYYLSDAHHSQGVTMKVEMVN